MLEPLPADVLRELQNAIGLALLEAMHEAELADPGLARVYAVWLSWAPVPRETRYNPGPRRDGGWL